MPEMILRLLVLYQLLSVPPIYLLSTSLIPIHSNSFLPQTPVPSLWGILLAQRTCFSWALAGWKCWAVGIPDAALNELQTIIGGRRPQLPCPSNGITLKYIPALSLSFSHLHGKWLETHLLLSVPPSLLQLLLPFQCFLGFLLLK